MNREMQDKVNQVNLKKTKSANKLSLKIKYKRTTK